MSSGPTNAEPTTPPDATEEFITNVIRLCDTDKAARVDLRSGLGLPFEKCHRMHRHLVRWISENTARPAREARYAVAALIAGRPANARGSKTTTATENGSDASSGLPADLGASLGEAVRRGAMRPNSAEATLHLLTRQRRTSIVRRLPALTGMLLRKEVGIDWVRLTKDLAWWDNDRDRIATRWLERYYRAAQPPAEPSSPSDHSDTDQ